LPKYGAAFSLSGRQQSQNGQNRQNSCQNKICLALLKCVFGSFLAKIFASSGLLEGRGLSALLELIWGLRNLF
jgi:hypothetical protein